MWSDTLNATQDTVVIDQWPDCPPEKLEKLPTVLYYHKPSYKHHSNPALDKNALIRHATSLTKNANAVPARYGYQVKISDPSIRCFKLLFDSSKELPGYVSAEKTIQLMNMNNRRDIDLATDYFSLLKDHVHSVLKQRIGAEHLKRTHQEIIVTVPAIWSEAAREKTSMAAVRAGWGDGKQVSLVSEPEAGAIYSLRHMSSALSVGNTFILCDAGGGTVDLTSYEVSNLDPLRLLEVTPSTRDLCGSTFLNERFMQSLKQKLGDGQFEMLRTERPIALQNVVDCFEKEVKKNFNPDDQLQEFSCHIPGMPDNAAAAVSSSYMVVTSADLV